MTETSAAELAEKFGLSRMGARPPLGKYLAEAWRRRYFAFAMSRYSVEAGEADSRLGTLWLLIRPILSAVVYGIVFGLILAGSRPHNFIAHLFVGVFTFEFFSKTFNSGAKAITGNQQLVSSLSFPRILLPVSAVLRNMIEIVPMFLTLFIILVILAPIPDSTLTGQWPMLSWVLVVPILAVMSVFNYGVALVSARLSVHFRDINQIIPFVSRLLFYGSGIFFSLTSLTENPTIVKLVELNPMYDFVAAMHSVVLSGYPPLDPYQWWVIAAWTVGLAVLGTVFFWQAEERYGRVD